MPNALPGSVYADEAKLYYSATLGGAGSYTEIPVVIDDTINSERRTAESNCRGDAEVKTHVGKPKHSITGTLLVKRGSPGTAYLALRAAYIAGTMLAWMTATGEVTNIDEHTCKLEGKIAKWDESRSDNDTLKVSFEVQPNPGSTYATTWAVVSA